MTTDYVTDTHALLWNLYAPSRLGRAAREAFVEADRGAARIHVPALVVAEMLMVIQRGRLPGVTLAQLLPHLEAMRLSENYPLCPLMAETVLSSHPLTSIPDIFDRLIVAEALTRRVPLLSRDSIITQAGVVSVVWD